MNRANFCRAAQVAALLLALSAPGMAQNQGGGASATPSPPRMAPVANMATALEAEYDSKRDYVGRASFLEDTQRQMEVWQASARFASCAVNFSEERARGLLDQAVEKKGASKKQVKLGEFLNRNQGCVVAAGGFDRDFLRGNLAEVILTDPASTPSIPGPGDVDAVKAFIKAVKAPSAKTDDPFVLGQLAAECRTGFAPIQVRAMLATEAGSASEKGALAVLKAVTPQCDSFAIADKPLTPWFERAFAAQALYHWVGLAPTLTGG